MTAQKGRPMARIEAAPAADEDCVERVARAIAEEWCTPLTWDAISLATQNECRRLARAAIAALKPAPGTDSSGQAVQRVLACVVCGHAPADHEGGGEMLHDFVELDDQCPVTSRRCDRPCGAECIRGMFPAVAGPQRDHDGEGRR